MDCSPPGFSIHGIFQARVLEWGAIAFSRGSSPPRDRIQVSHIAGRCFTIWASREALKAASKQATEIPPWWFIGGRQERCSVTEQKSHIGGPRPLPLVIHFPWYWKMEAHNGIMPSWVSLRCRLVEIKKQKHARTHTQQTDLLEMIGAKEDGWFSSQFVSREQL